VQKLDEDLKFGKKNGKQMEWQMLEEESRLLCHKGWEDLYN